MSVKFRDGELYLYGVVSFGKFNESEESFTASEVLDALESVPSSQDLVVHVNCPGGDAHEGMAIYAAIRKRTGRTNIVVEGIAASMGSIIAMAGTTVTMAEGSEFMIHLTWTAVAGNREALRRAMDSLQVSDQKIAGAYARKTGKSVAAMLELMHAETWMSAEDAIREGFADVATADFDGKVPPFDYRLYARAPKRLVDLAEANNWRAPFAVAGRALTNREEENNMTANSTAVAAISARIRSILGCAEAEGRKELAEHLAFETEMAADVAVKIMAKAPSIAANSGTPDPAEYERLRTLGFTAPPAAGAGLQGGSARPQANGRVDLVATMKRRHGIT